MTLPDSDISASGRIIRWGDIFMTHKIRRRAQSWTEYEYGRGFVRDAAQTPAEYEEGMLALADYLGL